MIAKRHFDELIRKLDRNNDLRKNYKSIILELKINGVVDKCPDKIIDSGYFMPQSQRWLIIYHLHTCIQRSR